MSNRTGEYDADLARNGHPIHKAEQPELNIVTFDELAEKYPRLKPSVIDGIARQGEVVNMIANPKVGKSWLAYLLALCIICGRDWLDTFPVTRGRVLIIDNELHKETISNRIPKVAEALGIHANEYEDHLEILSLRGRLTNFHGIHEVINRIEMGTYQVIITDAYYRMLPEGVSENDNAQIAGIYNTIDKYAAKTDAAWFLIHHATKGSQSEKRVTDVGAGAGSQSRAADAHLVLREHEETGNVVLDAAVRSFPPVKPIVLQWNFPIWTKRADLDPALLKGRLTKGDQRQQDKDAEGKRDIINVLRNWDAETDNEATPNRITEKSPYGGERTRNLLAKLLHSDDVKRKPIIVKHNKTHEYYLPDDNE